MTPTDSWRGKLQIAIVVLLLCLARSFPNMEDYKFQKSSGRVFAKLCFVGLSSELDRGGLINLLTVFGTCISALLDSFRK